jgi:hypothetical protein
MNEYSGYTARMLACYAAILAMVHGFFELQQRNVLTGGVSIQAIGPGCAADQIWHACFPAITLWPTFQLAGFFTILFSTATLVLVLFFPYTKSARWLIFIFTIGILLCGGGFIAAFTGFMAGGTLLIARNSDKTHKNRTWVSFLWFILIAFYLLYAAGGWILGKYFNTYMVNFSGLLFITMDILLPLLIIFLANFADHQINPQK